jgi:hypothetical protein
LFGCLVVCVIARFYCHFNGLIPLPSSRRLYTLHRREVRVYSRWFSLAPL